MGGASDKCSTWDCLQGIWEQQLLLGDEDADNDEHDAVAADKDEVDIDDADNDECDADNVFIFAGSFADDAFPLLPPSRLRCRWSQT